MSLTGSCAQVLQNKDEAEQEETVKKKKKGGSESMHVKKDREEASEAQSVTKMTLLLTYFITSVNSFQCVNSLEVIFNPA